jgi:hypothetical protein
MLTSSTLGIGLHLEAANIFIPLIRVAATVSFAIAPGPLRFVIIAVSEQLIRSMMVQP